MKFQKMRENSSVVSYLKRLVFVFIFIMSLAIIHRAQDDQFQQEKKLRSEIFNHNVRFASVGNSIEQVLLSVESVKTFLQERAEISWSDSVSQRLVGMEKKVIDNELRKLSVDDLVDLATDVLFWRLSVLSDQEIEGVIKTLRGDFFPSTPREDVNAISVRLRYDGSAMARIGDIVKKLRVWRIASKQNSKSLRNDIRKIMQGGDPGQGINGYVWIYRMRLPDRFGQVNESGATPLQALLLLYSVASDDQIDAPTSLLREMMNAKHGGELTMPSPQGRSPYGARGYLFAMPINLIFDDPTLSTLLDLMEKKLKAKSELRTRR